MLLTEMSRWRAMYLGISTKKGSIENPLKVKVLGKV